MTKFQNNIYWIELPTSKAIFSIGVIRLKETVLLTKSKWQHCLQFLQHTKEKGCLHRSRKCRCDRFDFSRKQIFSRRLQLFWTNTWGRKVNKSSSDGRSHLRLIFFLQNMKEHPFALWNQFSKKAKVSVGQKITCSSNFGEKSLKCLHFFSANTPSVR